MKRAWTALLFLLLALLAPAALARSYSLNDRADEIATIQRALTKLDLYYADITGRFGTKTERAVKLFQKKYGLEQTGVANQATLNKLYAVTGLSAPTSSGAISAVTLREGSSGTAVRLLQQQLKDLGYYTGSVTGTYGRLTREAVRVFQRKNGLSADGIAGKRTLARLSEVVSGASSSTSYSASSSSGAVWGDANAAPLGTSLLKHGMRGDAVTELQNNLRILEYYGGSVTGSYGNLTKEAVRLFQRDNDLSSDGVAGPRTLAAINDALLELRASEENAKVPANTSAIATPAPAATPSPQQTARPAGRPALWQVETLNTSWTLRRSSNNGHVKRLQTALKALGYFSDSCTGYYGSATEAAVIAFQRAKGLTDDGIAGRATLTAINSDVKNGVYAPAGTVTAAPQQTTAPAATPSPSGGKISVSGVDKLDTSWTLRRTSNNGHVTRLQTALKALGYFTDSCTGYYGSATEAAVVAYQRAKGLTDDGIAGRATLSAINEDIAAGRTINGPID